MQASFTRFFASARICAVAGGESHVRAVDDGRRSTVRAVRAIRARRVASSPPRVCDAARGGSFGTRGGDAGARAGGRVGESAKMFGDGTRRRSRSVHHRRRHPAGSALTSDCVTIASPDLRHDGSDGIERHKKKRGPRTATTEAATTTMLTPRDNGRATRVSHESCHVKPRGCLGA